MPLVPPCRLLTAVLTALAIASALPAQSSEYSPDWKSLNRHLVGRWFQEARLGIIVQWGVASVPGQSRDYARLMYLPAEPTSPNPVWVYHQKHYGHPSEFGYKDLLPYWEGQRWDPKALASLFKKTQAGYVVVLATDRDNIDLFDSAHHGWNAKRFGPRRNVAVEWAEALRAEGLKVGLALNNGRAWDYLRPAQGAEWEGPFADKPFDGNETAREGETHWWRGLDPRDLYGKPRPGNAFVALPIRPVPGPSGPDARFQETWFKRAEDAIAQVKPNVLIVEGGLPHGPWGMKLAASYFGLSNRGRPDPVNGHALVLPTVAEARAESYVKLAGSGQTVTGRGQKWLVELDLAKDGIRTDVPPVLSASDILVRLAETVSKGGNLLLRVALRSDGSLPEEQASVLEQLGGWLTRNKRAILGATAGPAITVQGGTKLFATRTDSAIYVIFSKWPGRAVLRVEGLGNVSRGRWNNGEEAQIGSEEGKTVIETPAKAPDDLLPVLEIPMATTDFDA
ncbi:MAG: alpha-L-fucosidase [Opitutaceae bacterium]|nr:alpha-L-fucosidase [Opitutaceae bacterium]